MVLVDKVVARYGENLTGHTFAIWGLAFKPKTDDMREAPSVAIINSLVNRGAQIQAFDPVARETAAEIFEDRIKIVDQPYDALEGATALLCVTEWNEFRHPDFDTIRARLRDPVIFDGRNLYPAEAMIKRGFEYYGIGVRDSGYE